MDSPVRLFNRQKTVHQIFGGGRVADVILWREKNVTVGILLVTLAAWVVFEKSGYTLLSLVANVLLLLVSILFVWAKAAWVLNRPPPPLPNFTLSEEMANEAAATIRIYVNEFCIAFQNIALGKDSKLFFKVAACLWLIAVIGGLANFLTTGYTSLVVILTIPVLFERYEDGIDKCLMIVYLKSHGICKKLTESLNNISLLALEKRKLS